MPPTASAPTPRRRAPRARLIVAALAAALLAAILAAPPALALSQRGHTYTAHFGSEGEGALSKPGAIAVSQSTGDVYVLDRRHNRIVQYDPQGEFISAWGWGVKTGAASKTYQVCTSKCHPGVAGRGEYQFNSYTLALAVDNCTHEGHPCTTTEDPSVGDVYVLHEYADAEQRRELKETEKEDTKALEEEEQEGKTFTEDEREAREHEFSEYVAIDKFSPEGAPLEEFAYDEKACEEERNPNKGHGGLLACEAELETEAAHGLTVTPDGVPLLYYGEDLYPLGREHLSQAAGTPVLETLVEEPAEGVAAGVAANSDGDYYLTEQATGPTGAPVLLASEWGQLTAENGETERLLGELSPALDEQDTSAIAVNPTDTEANQVDEQDDVYLANLTTEHAKQTGTVAQFDPEGHLIQRFSTAGLAEPAGVAVDPATGAVYVSDAATGQIDLFSLEQPAAPSVDSLSVQDVSGESAQLDAEIDPDGAETSYALRYSPQSLPAPDEPCTGPCAEVPGSQAALPAGYSDTPVSVSLTALAPGTLYHYRVIATNHQGAGEREASFSTPPATTAQDEADGRVWEMVSPAAKNGGAVESIDEETPHDGLIQAALDGAAITYMTTLPAGEAEGSRSYEGTQMLATRGPEGWSSQDIVTPNAHGTSPGVHIGSEYKFFSEDLSLSLVAPFRTRELNEEGEGIGRLAEPPLTPPATKSEEEKGQERTVYLRADKPVAPSEQAETGLYREAEHNGSELEKAAAEKGEQVPNPGYLALLTDANVLPGAEFGGEAAATLVAANPDLTSAVFLLGAGIAGAKEGMYDWSEGTLEPVTVPPCSSERCPPAEPAPDASIGNQNTNLRHAISDDGSRIVWSDNGHLYLRATKTPTGDSHSEETIRLDKAVPIEEPGEETNAGEATFQTANAEGSRVFFTDTKPLVEHAGAAPGKPDLYVCEIVENSEHKLECELTDLTPRHETPPHEVESANVQGTVIGASEDGAYVYFLADGVLSEAANARGEHAQPGRCSRGGSPLATCNIYMEHYDAETNGWLGPRFIATLAQRDSPDWESSYDAVTTAELDYITSRVSPNGRYLAFMSERELTHYENVDTQPQADSAHDEEVFEYAAPSTAEEQADAPGRLVCASCDPSGARPDGILDPSAAAHAAGAEFPLVDRAGAWSGSWLAGSIPGSTEVSHDPKFPPFSLHQSRYLSNAGRLYFDSPADLVPGATNGLEDVYEYEPTEVPRGRHECTTHSATFSERGEGCIGLISSGTASGEAAFLDASESGGEGPHGEQLQEGGGDVFFVSGAKLVPQDTEATPSLYDAHECTGGESCEPQQATPPSLPCGTSESCRPFSYSPPSAGSPASAAPSAQGNLAARHAVLPSVTGKPGAKPLTRAQKLAEALKGCRGKYRHARHKRAACERAARKRYGPVKHATKANKTSLHAHRPGGAR